MKNKILLKLLLIVLFPFIELSAQDSDGNTYKTNERLFHISRSLNKNLVCYDVNLDGDKLDVKKPINVYWVNREEKPGKTNGLNIFERKMAYGYKLISSDSEKATCSLTAYPGRQLTVAKKNGKYVCLIQIDNKKAILQSLYVKANPKNSLSVEYVELRGVTVDTNQKVTERVKK